MSSCICTSFASRVVPFLDGGSRGYDHALQEKDLPSTKKDDPQVKAEAEEDSTDDDNVPLKTLKSRSIPSEKPQSDQAEVKLESG